MPLVGQIPLEPAVSAGGDAGRPVVLSAPTSAAGRGFRQLAARVTAELLPPIDDTTMAGCTARMFQAIEERFAAADVATGGSPTSS